jgi:N-acetylneuraminate synthase
LIISTGMASIVELDETVRVAREAGCKGLVLLKSTSPYPATPANSHLRTIPHLRHSSGSRVGTQARAKPHEASFASGDQARYGAGLVVGRITLCAADSAKSRDL